MFWNDNPIYYKINGVSSLSEIKDAYKKHGPGKTIFFPSVWRICRYWSSFAVYRWRARFVLLNKVILHGPSTTLECPVCFVMRYCSPSPIVKNPKNTILPYLLIINGIHKTLKTCLCTKWLFLVSCIELCKMIWLHQNMCHLFPGRFSTLILFVNTLNPPKNILTSLK